MYETSPGQFGPYAHLARGAGANACRDRWNYDVVEVLAAHERFERAQRRAQAQRLWARITRRSRSLLDLSQIRCGISDRHYAGLEVVPINSIRGSEGRCRDFDCDFLPLQSMLAERWVSVFVAINQGIAIPPVVLIRVGDLYFVRDGHHRISVARVQGREEIEAEVTLWNASVTLAPAFKPAPAKSYQPAKLKVM